MIGTVEVEQAGHMTASYFCAPRYIFSCQAGPRQSI
jgi:hypothetical protein